MEKEENIKSEEIKSEKLELNEEKKEVTSVITSDLIYDNIALFREKVPVKEHRKQLN